MNDVMTSHVLGKIGTRRLISQTGKSEGGVDSMSTSMKTRNAGTTPSLRIRQNRDSRTLQPVPSCQTSFFAV